MPDIIVSQDYALDPLTGTPRDIVTMPEPPERLTTGEDYRVGADAVTEELAESAPVLNYVSALEQEQARYIAAADAKRVYWHGTSVRITDPLPAIEPKVPLSDLVFRPMREPRQGIKGTSGKSGESMPTPEGLMGRPQEVVNESLDERARAQRREIGMKDGR